MTTVERGAFVPTPKQQFALAADVDELLYGGSAGGGKSAALVIACLRLCRMVEGSRAVLIRRTSPELHELMLRVKEWEPTARWNGQESRFYFSNGSELQLGYAERDANVEKWQGTELQLVCFDELTHFCLTPDHEVLTSDGWQRIDAVSTGQKVLTMDGEKNVKYTEVSGTPSFPYDGPMIRSKSKRAAFTATPNHKIVVSMQKTDELRHVEVKDRPAYPRLPFNHTINRNHPDVIPLDLPAGRGLGSNMNATDEIDAETFAELLGWYMSEGSKFITNTSPCVSIRQTKPAPTLDALMERLPWRARRDGDGGYRIFSRQLYDLLPEGSGKTMRVPRTFMNEATPAMLRAFLDAFNLGDGYRNEHGSYYVQLANEGLVDDLQEVCTLLGIKSRKTGPHLIAGKYTSWGLSQHKPRGHAHLKPGDFSEEHYTGTVHCLTVPETHTFLVRREGTVWWSGNSKYQYTYLISRLRASGAVKDRMDELGIRPRAISSANPGSSGHRWVKSRFIDPAPAMTPFRTQHGDTRMYVPARLDENPHLDQDEYRKRLMALDPVMRRAMLEGDWDILLGDVRFPQWRRHLHVVEPEEYPIDIADHPRAVGVDYGVADPFAAVWGARMPDDTLLIYREAVETDLTAAEQAQLILDLEVEGERAPRRPLPVAADRSMWNRTGRSGAKLPSGDDRPDPGSIAFDYYKRFGSALRKSNSDRLAGWAMIDSLLRPRPCDGHCGVEECEGHPRLLVYSTCTNLIADLAALPRSKSNPEDAETTGVDDHTCLVAGTLVDTSHGPTPIESINAGDKVWTRAGLRRVDAAGMTGRDREVGTVVLSNGQTITGTPDHPVWVEGHGWRPLNALRYLDILRAWTPQSASQSSSEASSSAATPTPKPKPNDAISSPVSQTDSEASSDSTRKSGSTPTASTGSRTATTCTTRTATTSTTTPTTSNSSAAPTTSGSTGKVKSGSSGGAKPSRSLSSTHALGTGQRPASHSTASWEGSHGRGGSLNLGSARTAVTSSSLVTDRQGLASAPTTARRRRDECPESTTFPATAPSVEPSSPSTSTPRPRPVPVHVLVPYSPRPSADVYNLAVEGESEFFANGVLVHNCDALRYLAMDLSTRPVRRTSPLPGPGRRVVRPETAGLRTRGF